MPVRFSLDEGVGIVTFDRPEVLNAFDDELGLQVLETVEEAAEDPAVRCLVLTGAGRAFCAGEDLAALADTYEQGDVPDLGKTLERRYNPLIRAIRGAPKPVVAAVNGVAAGAGASIALACDFRIASEHAKLVIAFAKVGLVPDSGALWLLGSIVGNARAWEMAALGTLVNADEGLRLGLWRQVVPAAEFEASWQEFAADLASGPTKAFALTKQLSRESAERSLEQMLDTEIDAQSEAGRSADHLEGVRAFLEKRPPNFQGR